METFITLQNTYDDVQIGLLNAQDSPRLIASTSINKIHASKELIPTLNAFLQQHNVSLDSIPFIAVNQGPGPFTTLRVVITTVNGIAFATGVPLIGVDALEAVRQEVAHEPYSIKAILFNGFAFDVYLLIEENGQTTFKGYQNIDHLLATLNDLEQPVAFYGNGATLYHEKIEHALGKKAHFSKSGNYSSLEYIGRIAWHQWVTTKAGSPQLQPLYIKQHPVQQ